LGQRLCLALQKAFNRNGCLISRTLGSSRVACRELTSQADGTDKTCKSRANVFSNAWNNQLFDPTTGEAIEVENGTIPIELLDENGDPVKFGTGFIAPSNTYFRNRVRADSSNNVLKAKNRYTDETIDLVWAPARLFDIKRKTLELEIGVTF